MGAGDPITGAPTSRALAWRERGREDPPNAI
jgi:hypothetical protein